MIVERSADFDGLTTYCGLIGRRYDFDCPQAILARDVPMIPLWYRANMVIAQKRVGNIKISASGDWDFVRLLTVSK